MRIIIRLHAAERAQSTAPSHAVFARCYECAEVNEKCAAWARAGHVRAVIILCRCFGTAQSPAGSVCQSAPTPNTSAQRGLTPVGCASNPTFMTLNCPIACGTCSVTCRDLSDKCAHWADTGECHTNDLFMLEAPPPPHTAHTHTCRTTLAARHRSW